MAGKNSFLIRSFLFMSLFCISTFFIKLPEIVFMSKMINKLKFVKLKKSYQPILLCSFYLIKIVLMIFSERVSNSFI